MVAVGISHRSFGNDYINPRRLHANFLKALFRMLNPVVPNEGHTYKNVCNKHTQL